MAEKTEKKSGGGQIIKLALVLFAVSAIMALALGLIYEVTHTPTFSRPMITQSRPISRTTAPSPSSASPPPAASRPATSPRPRSPAPRA